MKGVDNNYIMEALLAFYEDENIFLRTKRQMWERRIIVIVVMNKYYKIKYN